MLSMTGRQRRATIPLSNKSFDAIGLGRSQSRHATGGEATLLLPLPPPRRGSFLYRSSDSDCELSPMSLSRKLSATTDQQSEGLLVTPFAQILQSLRSVRENYIALANLSPDPSRRQSAIADAEADNPKKEAQVDLSSDGYKKMAEETLSELEWCLEQLETIQTHKSVADMATCKFKRMLNRELNQFSESSRSGNEICEYIFNTFVDKQDCRTPIVNIEGPELDHFKPDNSDDVTDARSVPNTNCTTVKVTTFGIETENDDKIAEIMVNLDCWGPDVFTLAEVTGGRPLTVMAYTILKERDALKLLKISPQKLIAYLTLVEENYNGCNSYHNSIHAADVMQTSNYLLRLTSLQDIFTDLELLATLFASAVHDVDHPGVTNQYLIDSGVDLAVMYNDVSVLENHHLAVAFTLLKDNDANILENLSTNSYQTTRRMIIDIVLATDMSTHMSLLADLKTMVETQKVTRSGILHLENYSDRLQVLKTLVHCSDLSNPTKPLALYRQWTDRIMEEFFRQGDLERSNGLDISPICDRHTASIEKSQVGFIDYIVHPLWEAWGDLVYPDCQDILLTLQTNRDWFMGRTGPEPQDDVLKEEPNEEDEDDDVDEYTNNDYDRTTTASSSLQQRRD